MTTTTPDNEPLELGEPDSLAGTFADQIATLKRELAAAQERYDTLWALHDAGSVPYDLEIDRLRKRAEQAEARAEAAEKAVKLCASAVAVAQERIDAIAEGDKP